MRDLEGANGVLGDCVGELDKGGGVEEKGDFGAR